MLKDELQQVADVSQVAVYHNADAGALPDDVASRIQSGTIDWITVTSSAIVTQLHTLLPDRARQRIGRDVRLASLSPVTSETAARLGWDVSVEATEYTWEGLVHSLVERIAAERQLSPEPGTRAARFPIVILVKLRRGTCQRSSRTVSIPCHKRNAAPRMKSTSMAI